MQYLLFFWEIKFLTLKVVFSVNERQNPLKVRKSHKTSRTRHFIILYVIENTYWTYFSLDRALSNSLSLIFLQQLHSRMGRLPPPQSLYILLACVSLMNKYISRFDGLCSRERSNSFRAERSCMVHSLLHPTCITK